MKLHLYDKIVSPHITEKSTNLSEQNKIIFKVPKKANKKNLKKNIEKIFKVDVTKINIINKSEKKLSIASLITEKNNLKDLIIFDDFDKEIKKTKEMNIILTKFDAKNSLIILDKNSKEKIQKSIKNIPNVKSTDVNHFSAFDIVKHKKLIFTESSIKELEKRYI